MTGATILKAGMVTPLGFTASASCAAMRVAIDGFAETRFLFEGARLIGAQVPFDKGWRGREKLLRMAIPAIQECLSDFSASSLKGVPLLLCLAEEDRPGRQPNLDETMLHEIGARLRVEFSLQSHVFSDGRMGGVMAMERAGQLLESGSPPCVIIGVDSLLVGVTLEAYHEAGRLLTETNSNGFIPGEAAAAILLGPASSSNAQLRCKGIGYGSEPSSILSEEPLRAEGLTQAINNAFQDASNTWEDIDYRISDANGEQYWFKEASLAMIRTMRIRKAETDLWHPADCIGDVGAASVPCALGLSLYADMKRYAPGPGVLCHFSSDKQERGALILQGTMQRDSDKRVA